MALTVGGLVVLQEEEEEELAHRQVVQETPTRNGRNGTYGVFSLCA